MQSSIHPDAQIVASPIVQFNNLLMAAQLSMDTVQAILAPPISSTNQHYLPLVCQTKKIPVVHGAMYFVL
jgi:hypothetical protein